MDFDTSIHGALTCENDDAIEVKSTICSWIYGRDVKIQLNKDTIENHCGKIYYKEEVDEKVENK